MPRRTEKTRQSLEGKDTNERLNRIAVTGSSGSGKSSYVTQQTGNDAIGAFLIDTGGRDVTAVAQRVQALVGPSAKVTDIADTRGTVGSSLTAVNLAGLTRIELGFGLCLAVAAGALVLALRFAERRRTFAIANALGASRNQLRSFVVAEACVLASAVSLAGRSSVGCCHRYW